MTIASKLQQVQPPRPIAQPGNMPLTLDGITFEFFEIPEKLTSLGGTQSVATHDFPGGIRTLQKFGAFPPKSLSWSGYLYGPQAFDREQQLDRLRATGALVVLRYGRYAWSGIVSGFSAEPGQQYLLTYKLTFTPEQDLSGIATVPSGGETAESAMNTQLRGAMGLITGDPQQ